MAFLNNTTAGNNSVYGPGNNSYGPGFGMFMPPSSALANGIFLAVISPTTVVLNSLLLFAIYKDPFKTFQTPSAFFLIGLSITDLVCGLVVEPFPMTCYFMAYHEHPSTGKCFMTLFNDIGILAAATINASFLIVLAFTIVQYLAVSWPFKYKHIVTTRRTVICILTIWCYTFLFELSQKFGVSRDVVEKVDAILHTTIAFIVMVSVYVLLQRAFQKKIKLGLKLRAESTMQSTAQSIEGSPKAGPSKANQQNDIEKRFIRVNLFLIALLFFCTIPNCIMWYLYSFHKEFQMNRHFMVARQIADNTMWIKAMVDPVIFAWRLPKYRKALRKSFTRK